MFSTPPLARGVLSYSTPNPRLGFSLSLLLLLSTIANVSSYSFAKTRISNILGSRLDNEHGLSSRQALNAVSRGKETITDKKQIDKKKKKTDLVDVNQSAKSKNSATAAKIAAAPLEFVDGLQVKKIR